jgi:N-acyl amino acid synthase of PEP-CTERM/exosortase system
MFWLHRLNPANKFKEYLELVQAVSPELKDEVYHLRHRVYCDELGFERPSADGRERDEFDGHSRHLLLRSVKSGASIGCIRLVMAPANAPKAQLPFEKIFSAAADGRDVVPMAARRNTMAEVSRLTLAREFRGRRRPDLRSRRSSGLRHARASDASVRAAGAYLGALAHAKHLGVSRLFLLTEPRLRAHLKRLGFRGRQIGGAVEHRGQRVLSMADVSDTVAHLPFFMRPLYSMIFLEVSESRGVDRRHPYSVPHPERLTGQIGPGRAGKRPTFRHRLGAQLLRPLQVVAGKREARPGHAL